MIQYFCFCFCISEQCLLPLAARPALTATSTTPNTRRLVCSVFHQVYLILLIHSMYVTGQEIKLANGTEAYVSGQPGKNALLVVPDVYVRLDSEILSQSCSIESRVCVTGLGWWSYACVGRSFRCRDSALRRCTEAADPGAGAGHSRRRYVVVL
jgi:hypothetical protein